MLNTLRIIGGICMTDLRYIVLDIETSIKNRGDDAVGKMKASPFCEENKIVLIGCRAYDTDDFTTPDELTNGVSVLDPLHDAVSDYLTSKVDLLVGHNIKFDMLYLMRDYPAI